MMSLKLTIKVVAFFLGHPVLLLHIVEREFVVDLYVNSENKTWNLKREGTVLYVQSWYTHRYTHMVKGW